MASALPSQSSKSKWSPQVWAAFFFAIAAIGPIGSWLVLLFAAQSPSQSAFEAAAAQLSFVFSVEGSAPWWFAGWAALPLLLISLAVSILSSMSRRKAFALALFVFSLALSTTASVFYWPAVAALSFGGSVNAFRCYKSAT